MSWPIASSAIVLAILLVGWLAYERSRPTARMAAVVGTLAAVAALGRDAFVAVPDVKPITAIALVVGYALGPLPGFTVGAVGMLASNVMLGQGSYTPWQMAAWGLVGLIGAGLAALGGRRAGRLTIALACAVGALLAKEIMNVYTWTLSGTHTPAGLLAIAVAALSFDLTDVIASFLFGLAFGPELARLLARVRARMTVSWQTATPFVLLLALVAVLVPRAQAASSTGTVSGGVAYLRDAQNADGGFGAEPGQRSSELFSAWAAIGLAAAGQDPVALRGGGSSVLDSIRAEAGTLQGAGDLERTILALRACGASARSLPGGDPVARLLGYRAGDGSFGRLVNLTAFAILALRAAGESAGSTAVNGAARWLAHQQNPDGGFGYAARGTASDVDDTGAALQAVVAASVPDGPVVSSAVGYLQHAQNSDGGYPQERGGLSNAQSTAWAAQGLIAAGRNPSSVRRGGRSPLDYLRSLAAANGSVRYSAESAQTPVWVTGEALAALAGKPLPVAPAAAAVAAAPVSRALAHRAHTPHRRSQRSAVKAGRAFARVDALARGAGVLIAIVLYPALR
ncbi:MAG TPA: prenyltransferase/squalene oxidase repeat-containing protein [Solirubrobacteraceae bacterium]|nr:prenyltransferase/squalene oxidase repeat-containing protein [Solirubrobacteraceae bacterium]